MGLSLKNIGEKLHSSLKKLKKEKQPPVEPAESVKAPKLSEEAYSLLQKLYEELGPRAAATPESRSAARRIGEIFGAFADEVTITSGRIIPHLYRYMLFSVMFSSLLIFIFTVVGLPIISIAVALLCIFSVISELRMKTNLLRRFFPTGEVANVHGVIDPEGPVEHTVVLSAHHDTAAESKTEKEGFLSKLSIQTGAAGFVFIVILSAIELVAEAVSGRIPGLGLPHWSMVLLLLLALAFTLVSIYAVIASEGAHTRGAGDNLSGVAVIATLCRYFSARRKEGKGLSTTRLVFVSFDGEECGAAGSAVWYHDNSHILINPVNINFDGLYNEEDLAFLSSDGNGFVPLSASLASRCSLLSIEMGYGIQTGKLGLLGGSTDAASAAAAGIDATTLTSMAKNRETPAHTEEDTPDKVSQEALSMAMSVAIKLINEIDSKDEEEEAAPSILDSGRKYRLSRY